MLTQETKDKTVRLDVGGTLHKVSRDTLERCEGSMLASLISDHWKEGNADNDEPIFIDRNGNLFEYVLDYLRASEVYLPTTVSKAAVQQEFEFYGIDVDMSKLHETRGIEYRDALTSKIQAAQEALDLLKSEQLAVEKAALVEYNMMISTQESVHADLSSVEYTLLKKHIDLLSDRLLERGLELVNDSKYTRSSRSNPYFVVVKRSTQNNEE